MSNIAFGPVPSRRLGMSLGINNIPYKFCSYNCIYCQVGSTKIKTIKRKKFYNPEDIFNSVYKKIEMCKNIDYLTFVADGEPTLDMNLSKEVEVLRDLGYPIALITNSSLIWDEDVKNDLLNFDLVSFKVDSVDEKIWKFINRPHEDLILDNILDGILSFRDSYDGKIITETMILDIEKGSNKYCNEYHDSSIIKTAEFLKELDPDTCYLNVPIRPTSENYVSIPKKERAFKITSIFKKIIGKKKVMLLKNFEGDNFLINNKNFIDDILSITAVHPIREEIIKKLIESHEVDVDIIDNLIREGKLKKIKYEGKVFYICSRESQINTKEVN